MLRMTDSTPPTVPGPSAAVAKGIALGLGVLLLGGTALLITLLVTRKPTSEVTEISDITLQAGDKVTDVSLFEQQALLLIESADGSQTLVYVDLVTGARREVGLAPE